MYGVFNDARETEELLKKPDQLQRIEDTRILLNYKELYSRNRERSKENYNLQITKSLEKITE